MAKTKTTKVACPNCHDASRRNQRPLNDEDHQLQCRKCGMVYRVDEPIKTYEAIINGRKVRCTVPEDDKPEDILADAIRDCFGPQAVAVMANALRVQINRGVPDAQVRRQVRYMADLMVGLVGGEKGYRLARREAGL